MEHKRRKNKQTQNKMAVKKSGSASCFSLPFCSAHSVQELAPSCFILEVLNVFVVFVSFCCKIPTIVINILFSFLVKHKNVRWSLKNQERKVIENI